MSAPADEKTEKKEPGRVSRFFTAVREFPGRLSLPARAGCLMACFLFCVVIAVWIAFYVNPDSVPWRHSLTYTRMLAVLALIVVIPWVVYHGLRLWMEGDPSEFPDLEYAWTAGLDALAANGLSLDSVPLFLVLGSPDERVARAIVHASGRSLRVHATPSGPAPLHWFASPDAIYLFCTDASWLSALARLVAAKPAAAVASSLGGLELPGVVQRSQPKRTPAPPRPAPAAQPGYAPGGSVKGTISLDQFVASRDAARESPAMQSDSDHEENAGEGTMILPEPVSVAAYAPLSTGGEAQVAVLAAQDSAEQLRRLKHVCERLRRARAPLCPLNGVLALVPFEAVQSNPREAEELQRAVRSDLNAVHDTAELRCPVTVIVTGLERERGFSELVRRVGRQRAAVQRFGRGFDVRSQALKEELAALGLHACGAFEDWIYTLFREEGALSRPGNAQLYSLLCKVRCNLKGRLTDLLAEGVGFDPQQPDSRPMLFSGCYFAATGETEDRQAFVKGVFDKLDEEQEEIEWTPRAVRDYRVQLRLAYAGWAVCAVLLVSLAMMVVQRVLT